jgi:hypothetical protein
MGIMVTKEQWQLAQLEERKFHTESFQEGRLHYAESYNQYFRYLNIDLNLQFKDICEIGPADFPALDHCFNLGPKSFVIEPMPSENLKRTGLKIVQEPAEDFPYLVDEVWLMNVLQHVMDPYKIVERAIKQSKIIRFFEPINYGVNECHPWNLTLDMFKNWFGDAVNYYPPNQPVHNFHTWECVYGVYNCK